MGTRWAERRWSCGTGGDGEDGGDGEKPSVCRSPIKQKARWLGFVCLDIPAPLLGQGKWVAVSGGVDVFPSWQRGEGRFTKCARLTLRKTEREAEPFPFAFSCSFSA